MTAEWKNAAVVPAAERADRDVRAAQQAGRLRTLLDRVSASNGFYTRKLGEAGVDARSVHRVPEDLSRLPLTTKSELVRDQDVHPPWGTVLTEPLDRYTRYCQTSSTTGSRPLRWLDTNESWQWMIDCWKAVYRAAHVGSADSVLFAFSFGPFLGFWTAFDAACQLGAQTVPSGGMSSQQRLALIDAVRPSVLCCTPTYALRLAEIALQEGRQSLADSSIRTIIVAGEPGGSIPATRQRIEASWGARVMDHHGLTEVGPVSFECWENPGSLHVNENEYICEVLDPTTLTPVLDGERGELVLTNLGRSASPAIRYRTGDIVIRRSGACRCGRTLARFEGGVVGRADDMVTIRGINVYPAAIEAIVRRVAEVAEFRTTVNQAGSMLALSVEIEVFPGHDHDARAVADRVTRELGDGLGLTASVRVADAGSLPRFEMKSRRFVREA